MRKYQREIRNFQMMKKKKNSKKLKKQIRKLSKTLKKVKYQEIIVIKERLIKIMIKNKTKDLIMGHLYQCIQLMYH
jgi:hypothetical protein